MFNYLVDCIIIIAASSFKEVFAQLNLGSFNLYKNPYGDLQLGLGQGGNIFGYGADRSLTLNIGPGRFGTITNSGVMLGGERVGLDSQLGVSENQGLNLGSLLRLGNNGGIINDPLGSMLRNIGSFLQLPNTSPNIPSGLGGTRFLRPSSGRGGPPLLPGRSSPEFVGNGQESGESELPLSVGNGWDGEDQDFERSGSGESPKIRKVEGSSTDHRNVLPIDEMVDLRKSNRITTEGKRRETFNRSNGESDERRHDGGTGEFKQMGKLPVPDGLEAISEKKNLNNNHA